MEPFRARSPSRWPAALRLDGFDALLLVAFVLVSVWVIGVDLLHAGHGRVWTGTDGVYLADQLQYVAWVRDASHHVLISNLFVLRATPADYFQPAIALSGALSALGLAPWLALLLWKPVAVAACFYALRRYVALTVPDLWPRRTALVLALFFGSFTVAYGSFTVIGDLLPWFLSWGYVFALLALAAITVALIFYQRARAGGRLALAPGLLGAVASSLHPWHGALLIAILLGAELVAPPARGSRGARLGLFALTILLTGLPLLYYAVLGRTDVSWRLARVASKHGFSLWWILLALAPLLLAALPAYRERSRSFLAAATWVWPLAALLVYAGSESGLGATPLHAFEGITLPLAVLAVSGAPRWLPQSVRQRPVLVALVLAAFTIPVIAYELNTARSQVSPRTGTARFITPDEQRALDYLRTDPAPGGVIARSYLGLLVPSATGRHTLVGNCLWSEPDCAHRLVEVRDLFGGAMTAGRARAFVGGEPAAFLLADCRGATDLRRLLGALVGSVRRFGCASVYRLRPAARTARAEPPRAARTARGRHHRV